MKFSRIIPKSRSKTAKVISVIAAILLPSVIAYGGYLAYARFERKKYIKKIKTILFLGDSQSASNKSYADIISSNMEWEYSKHAKVGAKTEWVYKEYLQDENYYDAVAVMIGGNDVWALGNSDKAIQNLKSIKSVANNRNQILILISPPSKDFYSDDEYKLLEYNKIAMWMRSNADLYVDGNSATSRLDYFKNDKLHLNELGQRAIASLFLETLQEV